MTRWGIYAWMTATLTVLLFGCGYHFSGSGAYPAGVSKVFVTIVENRSAETGVETVFTNDLIYEFTRNREESIAADRSSADGVLSGTLVRLSVDNIARSSVSTAVERRVTGVLNLRLESADGRLLWASGNIVERQAYSVVRGDKAATDRRKSDAIAAVSKKLAESAFNQLTDNF